MRYAIICLLFAFSISCSSKNKKRDPNDIPAGGPCSYKSKTLPARVIDIRREPNSQPSVFFEVSHNLGDLDTISYFTINNRNITEEEIKQKGVAKDAVFQLEVSEITSGSCNPMVRRLSLEKFIETPK
jgi:hypothetical protein